MSDAPPVQRMRLTYRKTEALQYVAHLDTMRTWERAFRRARLPLAYSQGFSPHPRLALGAPLPVGAAGERELLDAWFDERLTAPDLLRALAAVLPPGLEAIAAQEVDLRTPAIQASLDSATYHVHFAADALDAEALRRDAAALIARDTMPWEETRGSKTRNYDLRATIRDLDVQASPDGGVLLEMDLRLAERATGRADSILRALQVEAAPRSIVRTEIRLTPTETDPDTAAPADD